MKGIGLRMGVRVVRRGSEESKRLGQFYKCPDIGLPFGL